MNPISKNSDQKSDYTPYNEELYHSDSDRENKVNSAANMDVVRHPTQGNDSENAVSGKGGSPRFIGGISSSSKSPQQNESQIQKVGAVYKAYSGPGPNSSHGASSIASFPPPPSQSMSNPATPEKKESNKRKKREYYDDDEYVSPGGAIPIAPGSEERHSSQKLASNSSHDASGSKHHTPVSSGLQTAKSTRSSYFSSPGGILSSAMDTFGIVSPTLEPQSSSSSSGTSSHQETALTAPTFVSNISPSLMPNSEGFDLILKLDSLDTLPPQELYKLLRDLDGKFFALRTPDKYQNLEVRALFSTTTLLKTCILHQHLTQESSTHTFSERDQKMIERSIKSIIGLSLNNMPSTEKVLLLQFLSNAVDEEDPTYSLLSAKCFEKFFKAVDEKRGYELTKIPANERNVNEVIRKLNQDIDGERESITENGQAKIAHLEKVRDFAQFLLAQKIEGKPIPNMMFHATNQKSLDYMINKEQIPVSHGKAHQGAFTSSIFEKGFGDWGVAVDVCELAARQKNLCRIERRATQDGGQVWTGSLEPLPIIEGLIIYNESLPQFLVRKLKTIYPRCKFFAADVINTYSKYAKDKYWYTPVPLGTTNTTLEPHTRPRDR